MLAVGGKQQPVPHLFDHLRSLPCLHLLHLLVVPPDLLVYVFELVVYGLDPLIVELVVVALLAVLLVVRLRQLAEDGFFALRHWFDEWVQSEDGRVLFWDILDYPVGVVRIHLAEPDGPDELAVKMGLQDVGADEVLNEQVHLGAVNVVCQLADVSDLTHHVFECLEVDVLYFQPRPLFLEVDVAFVLVDVEVVLCDLFERLDGVDEVSRVELILEIPPIGLELGEVVDDRVHVGEHEGQLPVLGVHQTDGILLPEVPDLVFDAHGLLDDVLVAVAGDFFVEAFELGGDEDQPELFVGRPDLELLQHFGEVEHEVAGDVQVVDYHQVLLADLLLKHHLCQLVLPLPHRNQDHVAVSLAREVLADLVERVFPHYQQDRVHVVAPLEPAARGHLRVPQQIPVALLSDKGLAELAEVAGRDEFAEEQYFYGGELVGEFVEGIIGVEYLEELLVWLVCGLEVVFDSVCEFAGSEVVLEFAAFGFVLEEYLDVFVLLINQAQYHSPYYAFLLAESWLQILQQQTPYLLLPLPTHHPLLTLVHLTLSPPNQVLKRRLLLLAVFGRTVG